MLEVFDGLRRLTLWTIVLRLFLVVISAGIVGIVRTYRHSPAGFRTHILLCIGACMATMTGQFLIQWLGMNTDITRMGAQVVAGVGFICGGTIITTGQRIKGLTTAAGLWAIAMVGLCYGSGFYEAGIIVTVLIVLVEEVLSGVEGSFTKRFFQRGIYVQYREGRNLECVQEIFRRRDAIIVSIEFERIENVSKEAEREICAVMKLKIPRGQKIEMIIQEVRTLEGITVAEIL